MVRLILVSFLGFFLFGLGIIGFETIVEAAGASRDGIWSTVYVFGMLTTIVCAVTWLQSGEALVTVLLGPSVAAAFSGILLYDSSNQWSSVGSIVSYGLTGLGVIGILIVVLYQWFWTWPIRKK